MQQLALGTLKYIPGSWQLRAIPKIYKVLLSLTPTGTGRMAVPPRQMMGLVDPYA